MTANPILTVNRAWDRPDGLLARIRSGDFDPDVASDFLESLRVIEVEGPKISADLVRLIWFLPLFLEWQQERVLEKSGIDKEYKDFTSRVFDEVHRILGMP